MTRLNPSNERLKRDYIRYLKEAKGKSEATLDAVRKALARYEAYTAAKDFKTFRREQAIGFKTRLAETEGVRTGEGLSASTQASTLTALKDFFTWLSWQPGFKSKVHMADIDYLSPSNKDAARAKAAKLRAFPSLEQVRATVAAMPGVTVIDRRNRALVAFTLLTGIRDRALVSLSLGHVDTSGKTPVVAQDPNSVETKFAKAIVTYFFPVGDDLADIALAWIEELRKVHLFGPADPLFPRTHMGLGDDGGFVPVGIERDHWSNASPVREIFRKAFERAGLPYFPPHAFRHTLGHLAQTMCRTPEELKAWSQNLGHENIATTLTSYGRIAPHRQGEVMGRMGREADGEAGDVLAQIGALLARQRGTALA
ncbi:tyrosine-type recombinase/integrase [Xanthobacter flavus]|uniref:tyrosine-type recombinase/integrase n=1 Tax=Xanthobacter flavus TaxID=281 RepID=UPI001AE202E4|nr:tyrosine-type recombinase/integrase [Xanthobacter flavus]MBP2150114.1 integrase [Xanthobacter flavus]